MTARGRRRNRERTRRVARRWFTHDPERPELDVNRVGVSMTDVMVSTLRPPRWLRRTLERFLRPRRITFEGWMGLGRFADKLEIVDVTTIREKGRQLGHTAGFIDEVGQASDIVDDPAIAAVAKALRAKGADACYCDACERPPCGFCEPA